MKDKSINYDLNARFKQAIDAIISGYIEERDVAELKKLIEKESQLRADRNCSPREYRAESLRQLLQETPALLDMVDSTGKNLLQIAKSTNIRSQQSAIDAIEEESGITRWRRSVCKEKIKAPSQDKNISESQRIREKYYSKIGIFKNPVGIAHIEK